MACSDGTSIGQPMNHHGRDLFRDHADPYTAVAFSPHGQILATVSGDQSARLWQVADSTPFGSPLVHHKYVAAVSFSPDGRLLATASWDKTARLWRVADGMPIGQPMNHQSPVRAVAFSLDGQLVATASEDETARLWRVADSTPFGPPLEPSGSGQRPGLQPRRQDPRHRIG